MLANKVFTSSNPAVAASVHTKWSMRRSRRYNGNAFSPSLEIKRLKAATDPASFWTYLRSVGGANCDRARILAGFASIPLLETMNPSSFPAGTPKTHFSGLSRTSYVQIERLTVAILSNFRSSVLRVVPGMVE